MVCREKWRWNYLNHISLHEIIIRGLAPNIKSAKLFLEKKDTVVYDILEEITKDHPVLLNRAPTLHKLSILGFYPVLTDDNAIKLHPAVCSGYNADFDGDAMGVFLPLSKMAIDEVKQRMFPYHNLLKPSDGSPIVLPNKEMALGCYYLTTIDSHMETENPEDLKFFATENEAMRFQAIGKIKLRQPINVGVNGKIIKTTVGRIIFNQALPFELRFVNSEVKASDLKNIVVAAMKLFENEKVGELIDKLKEIGFWASTIAGGLSLSIFDCQIIPEKTRLLLKLKMKLKNYKNFEQGLLTSEEKDVIQTNFGLMSQKN